MRAGGGYRVGSFDVIGNVASTFGADAFGNAAKAGGAVGVEGNGRVVEMVGADLGVCAPPSEWPVWERVGIGLLGSCSYIS